MGRPSVVTVLGVVALAAAVMLGLSVTLRLTRAQVRADVYRAKLEELARDYSALAEQYNTAVRRTAVTELVVADGQLSVRIRDAAGRERVIPTPFDPSDEIYADFVVLDGRLWLRRIFDRRTAPSDALVIDPAVDEVDWDRPGAGVGKTVYRSLAEGVWTVTVTGDGSLGLERAVESRRRPLAHAPEVREFEELVREAEQLQPSVGPLDVLRAMFGLDPL